MEEAVEAVEGSNDCEAAAACSLAGLEAGFAPPDPPPSSLEPPDPPEPPDPKLEASERSVLQSEASSCEEASCEASSSEERRDASCEERRDASCEERRGWCEAACENDWRRATIAGSDRGSEKRVDAVPCCVLSSDPTG